MEKKIGLLIFDLDGTLADTMNSIKDSVNITLSEYSLPERSYEEIKMAIGNGARELIRRSIPAEKEGLTDEILAKYNANYELTYANANCYEGMADTLGALKERGYTLAVLSNKPDHFTQKLIEVLFPDRIFSVVMGHGKDFPRKPDPASVLAITRELGFAPEQAAFIGDSEVDILTGKNAGMTTVGCAWGYRGAEALKAVCADTVIYGAAELAEIFK